MKIVHVWIYVTLSIFFHSPKIHRVENRLDLSEKKWNFKKHALNEECENKPIYSNHKIATELLLKCVCLASINQQPEEKITNSCQSINLHYGFYVVFPCTNPMKKKKTNENFSPEKNNDVSGTGSLMGRHMHFWNFYWERTNGIE